MRLARARTFLFVLLAWVSPGTAQEPRSAADVVKRTLDSWVLGELEPTAATARLAELGAAGVAPLRDCLGSEEPVARRARAAEGLGWTGSVPAGDALLTALADDSPDVRSSAGRALEMLRAEVPQLDLVRRLQTKLPWIERKDAACLLLGRIGTAEAKQLLFDLVEGRGTGRDVLDALGGLWCAATAEDGPRLLEAFEAFAESESVPVERKLCLLLGKTRCRVAVPALIDRLGATDAGLVKDAHWALVEISGQRLRADVALWRRWWKLAGAR